MTRPRSQMASTRRWRAQQISGYVAARSIVSRCCYSPIERVDGAFRCSLCERVVDPKTGKDVS